MDISDVCAYVADNSPTGKDISGPLVVAIFSVRYS